MRCQTATIEITSDSGNVQLAKVKISTTSISDNVTHLQNYGLASNHGGTGLVISVGGNKFVIGLNDLNNRPKNLNAGETQVWSKFGQKIHLKADGSIEFDATQFKFNANVEVVGKIKSSDDMVANDISLTKHTHTSSKSDTPTSAPSK